MKPAPSYSTTASVIEKPKSATSRTPFVATETLIERLEQRSLLLDPNPHSRVGQRKCEVVVVAARSSTTMIGYDRIRALVSRHITIVTLSMILAHNPLLANL